MAMVRGTSYFARVSRVFFPSSVMVLCVNGKATSKDSLTFHGDLFEQNCCILGTTLGVFQQYVLNISYIFSLVVLQFTDVYEIATEYGLSLPGSPLAVAFNCATSAGRQALAIHQQAVEAQSGEWLMAYRLFLQGS